MTRKVNAATLAHIKASEGLRLNAYPDPGSRNGDPWTIGYGSTSGVKKGMTITAAEAEARLVADLTYAENTVSRLVKVPLNDNQFGALVSFVFNIGAGAFEKSTLLRILNAGDYAGVTAQLARWNKNDGKVMDGLTKRRAAEAKLFNTVPVAQIQPAPPQPDINHYPQEPLPQTPAESTAQVLPKALIGFAIIVILALGAFFFVRF